MDEGKNTKSSIEVTFDKKGESGEIIITFESRAKPMELLLKKREEMMKAGLEVKLQFAFVEFVDNAKIIVPFIVINRSKEAKDGD